MKTKIFISWSGNYSRKVAEVLRRWLPIVIQSLDVYFSPEDNKKGDLWDNEIDSRLKSTDIGVICLTPENLSSAWLLFESGALSKSENAKVCTFLFDVKNTDITSPLSRFQSTDFNKKQVKQLINDINECSGQSKLDSTILDQSFEQNWPQLNKSISKISKAYQNKGQQTEEIRDERELLEEILELARQNNNNPKHFIEDYYHSNNPFEMLDYSVPVYTKILGKTYSTGHYNDIDLHFLPNNEIKINWDEEITDETGILMWKFWFVSDNFLILVNEEYEIGTARIDVKDLSKITLKKYSYHTTDKNIRSSIGIWQLYLLEEVEKKTKC